ncbi:MAG: SDR family NAD(P)-dependent oxidoreductase, partial [Gammaproteobacteria bacterium]
MTDWQGRTAIVTGAASGIGRAAASLILERGGRVVAVDLKPGGCDWVQELDGARARSLSGDVTDPAVNAAAVAASEDLGGLDAVLLNAGLPISGTLESVEMAAFDRVIDVNLRAVVLGVRAALPALRRGTAPAIAVTASVSGLGGDPGLWAYNAAKGGVVNFVRSAALELGRSGIRINAV